MEAGFGGKMAACAALHANGGKPCKPGRVEDLKTERPKKLDLRGWGGLLKPGGPPCRSHDGGPDLDSSWLRVKVGAMVRSQTAF